MLLTIGMIVKNEEKYLRKCLEALQPILKSISSELIIVDTGSTDRTVEIAKEFTDKVLFFEWVNDFSAARNYGLERAKGEWFMAVDADEIFISCDDIINFFKSGEYKQFNSASFSVRNYSNPERTGRYVDFYVPRLTKILPETRYENPVHEKLNTHRPPLRLLKDVADHYGYIKAVSSDKAKRNYEILKKRLDSGEESSSLYRELFESLNADSETREQAYEYLEKGIELCIKTKDDYVLALYHCAISACIADKRYDEALQIYDKYFSLDKEIKNEIRNTDLEIIAFAAIALYSLDRYEEGYGMMTRYFDLYRNIEKNNINTRDILYSYRYMSDEKAFAEMNIYYAMCCTETGRFKDAEESFANYPASTYSDNTEHYLGRINQECSLIKKYDAQKLAAVLSEGGSKLQPELFNALRSAVFAMDAEKRNAVLSELEKAEKLSDQQKKLISIYKGHFSENGTGIMQVIDYIGKFGMDYPDLFMIIQTEGVNPIKYASECDNRTMLTEIGISTISGYLDGLSKLDFSAAAREDILASVEICLVTINGLLKKGVQSAQLLTTAGNLGIKYLEAFGESSIPQEIMAAVTMAEINILRSSRDYRGCIGAVRRLLQLGRNYAPIASAYQNIIKSEMALYMK
ncbi:MAG: glycosyltransferase family 2 protein [Oscillospiraceae bacterium]|nr:glycosyltransferase family 2 protein [Oscillospiraceae bacterium]